MRSEKEIKELYKVLRDKWDDELRPIQRTGIAGLCTALAWVLETGKIDLKQVMSEIVPGIDLEDVKIAIKKDLMDAVMCEDKKQEVILEELLRKTEEGK